MLISKYFKIKNQWSWDESQNGGCFDWELSEGNKIYDCFKRKARKRVEDIWELRGKTKQDHLRKRNNSI